MILNNISTILWISLLFYLYVTRSVKSGQSIPGPRQAYFPPCNTGFTLLLEIEK